MGVLVRAGSTYSCLPLLVRPASYLQFFLHENKYNLKIRALILSLVQDYCIILAIEVLIDIQLLLLARLVR